MARSNSPVPPRSPASDRPRRTIFYGWWIALAGSVLQLLQGTVIGQSYGAYAVVLREEFGWTKTLLSGASALREMESGITGPLQGWVLDRFGARRVARAGIVALALGLFMFSRIQDPVSFYLAFVVMALGASMMGYLTLTYMMVQWFERRRSTALSLMSMGGALGGVLLPVTVVLAMNTIGWRGAAFYSAVIVLVVGLPLCQLLVNSPQEKGLLPDGDVLEPQAINPALQRAPEVDFTLREALRTRAFWWVCFGHGSALFVVSAVNVHLLLHLTESLGYSLNEASSVMSLITAMFMIGNLGGGIIGDYASKRLLAMVAMVMHMIGLVLMSHAVNTPMVVAGAVIHGLAWGGRGPQMAAIRADYFGRTAFGKIMGVSNGIIIIGTIAGPMIAGYMYDTLGNYTLGFDILSAMSGAGSLFFLLARRPAPPQRLQEEAARAAEVR